ncbi:MAG: hypothetical protein HYX76_11430 [Acidobacteria bacterium]|nr:hypothetical protein [Acidobacteriota bacterium]
MRGSRRGHTLVHLLVLVAALAGGMVRTSGARQAAPSSPSVSGQLLGRAVTAEFSGQYDRAIDSLYQIVVEHPGTPEIPEARLQLARLLALSGSLSAAVLQCQAVRDETREDQPEHAAALGLATTIARRLRAEQSGKAVAGALPAGVIVSIGAQRPQAGGAPAQARAYFNSVEAFTPGGLTPLDDPSGVVLERNGALLVVDGGRRSVQRVSGNVASAVTGTAEPAAAAVLPDGSLVLGGAGGFNVGGQARALAGPRGPLRKVRAIATNSKGDLFVVDRDHDGTLRCKGGTPTCVAWGPVAKMRTVKIGASDLVYLLDERGETVRVVDDNGRQLTVFGPLVGATRIEKLVDIAVDSAYTVFMLDADAHRIQIGAVKLVNGQISPDSVAGIVVPAEGDRAMKTPAAIGVGLDGSVIVAGRGAPRLLRFR